MSLAKSARSENMRVRVVRKVTQRHRQKEEERRRLTVQRIHLASIFQHFEGDGVEGCLVEQSVDGGCSGKDSVDRRNDPVTPHIPRLRRAVLWRCWSKCAQRHVAGSPKDHPGKGTRHHPHGILLIIVDWSLRSHAKLATKGSEDVSRNKIQRA